MYERGPLIHSMKLAYILDLRVITPTYTYEYTMQALLCRLTRPSLD